jgi:hypothetical protein
MKLFTYKKERRKTTRMNKNQQKKKTSVSCEEDL